MLRTRDEIVVATDRKYQGIWEVSPKPKGEEDREAPEIEALYQGRPPREK